MQDDFRCALVARASEPLPGTAPEAPTWLLVEDHGPWGRDALQDGRLPSSTTAKLATGLADHGVRYQAIRRPDRTRRTTRAVFEVNVTAGWMARRDLPVEDLADLDVAEVTAPAPPVDARVVTDPVVAVCTHGTRDACCAVWGRPLVTDLAARMGDAVWETSHTGGHRFAPSVLVFPHGGVHGDIQDVDAFWHATAGDRIDLATYRGSSGLPRPAQAAEVAVRRRLGLDAPGAVATVDVVEQGDEATVHVVVRGNGGGDGAGHGAGHGGDPAGGDHTVVLVRRPLADAPVSCGADPVARDTWEVTDLRR